MATNAGVPVLYRLDSLNTYPAGSSVSLDLSTFASTLLLTDGSTATGVPATAGSVLTVYAVCDMGTGANWSALSLVHNRPDTCDFPAVFLSSDGATFNKVATYAEQQFIGIYATAVTATSAATPFRYLLLVFTANGSVNAQEYREFTITFSVPDPCRPTHAFDSSTALFTAFVSKSSCRPTVSVLPARSNAGDEMDMAQDHASGLITIVRSIGAA